MKIAEADKNKKREYINSLLSMLRFQLDGLYALGLDTDEKNTLQGIYPNFNRVQDGINRLFSPVEIEHPEQELKQGRHGGIARR